MSIPILMYHQIDVPPPRGTPLRGLVVSPASFAWQMQALDFLGYRGCSMRELEPYLSGQRTGKVVGITFDDGYQNNLHNALPVLRRFGFTATCYAVSSMLGGSNSWDQGLVALKPLMTEGDYKAWLAAGMDVGSHTRTHADLEKTTPAEALDEIQGSRTELETRLQCEVRHFCYPYGRFSDLHCQLVRDAGYTTATTTRRGRVQANDDSTTLRRIMVAQATNPFQFALKVLTSYEDRRG
jgi:peptidoglycan/xylan/chitin deacetylase (PgdA/CDA1 family)